MHMFKKTPGLELLSTCSDKCGGGDDDEQLTFNELQGIEKERREILLRVSVMQLCLYCYILCTTSNYII